MRVICNYYTKCREFKDFTEEFCSHSHDHDKKYGCIASECGFLDDHGIKEKVYCESVLLYERKLKLKKLNEQSSV